MTLADVKQLAHERREKRWAKERAEKAEREAHVDLINAIAEWKKVDADAIKISHTACMKAPVDLTCTFVSSYNPFRNPCVFCGNPEDDVF